MAFDFTKAAGAGTNSIDESVLGLPFIKIIQKGSPEFDETHRDYATKRIEGCRPGDILFAPRRLILQRPVEVIPVAQHTCYTEWKSPQEGKGFVGHQTTSIISDPRYSRGHPDSKEKNKEYLTVNGHKHELIYTIYVAVLFKHEGQWKKGLIDFSSTQLKAARQWTKSLLNVRLPDMPEVKAPIFASQWKLATKAEQNAQGGWFGWDIQFDKVLNAVEDEALLTQAHASNQEAEASFSQGPSTTKTLTDTEVVTDNTEEDGAF